jgi:osmotically-inducible protein OsmY
VLSCAGGAAGYAQDYNTNSTKNNDQQNMVQPDNTQVNERDWNANAPTADQQKDNEADRSITQRIRRAIISDKSLSMYAHNVKVITQGGVVTLKGPVRSTREKDVIVKKAIDVTGSADKVTDQISIKRKNNQNTR